MRSRPFGGGWGLVSSNLSLARFSTHPRSRSVAGFSRFEQNLIPHFIFFSVRKSFASRRDYSPIKICKRIPGIERRETQRERDAAGCKLEGPPSQPQSKPPTPPTPPTPPYPTLSLCFCLCLSHSGRRGNSRAILSSSDAAAGRRILRMGDTGKRGNVSCLQFFF